MSSVSNYAQVSDDLLLFNNNTSDMLRKLSETLLIERLIVAEGALAVAIFLWILISVIEEKLNPNNRNNHGPMKEIGRFLKDIKDYWQFMSYAAKADLKAEVANSYLNRLWWLLEPFFNMLVYVIVLEK